MRRAVLAVVVAAVAVLSTACVTDPGPPPELAPNTCLDGLGLVGDLLYVGHEAAVRNVHLMTSVDGTCGGPVRSAWTAVFAANAAEALALCEARGSSFGPVFHLQLGVPNPPDTGYPEAPLRMWGCQGSEQLPIGPAPAVGACWQIGNGYDVGLFKPLGVEDNFELHVASGSPCQGALAENPVTVVFEASQRLADDACAAVDPNRDWVATTFWTVFPALPVGLFECSPIGG